MAVNIDDRMEKMKAVLPFLRQNGNEAWRVLLDEFGFDTAYEMAQMDRNKLMEHLRVEYRWTLERVGETFGITRERVRQLTPPGIWFIQEAPVRTPEQVLAEIMPRAMHDKTAWTATGCIRRGWIAEQVGSTFKAHNIKAVLPRKFEALLMYGLGLSDEAAMLEWIRDRYYKHGQRYEDIAEYLSKKFVPISTMNVFHGCHRVGFIGHMTGRRGYDY